MSTKAFPSYWPPSNEHEKTFRPYLLRSIVKGSVPSLLTVSKRQNGVRLLLATEWLEDLVIFRWYLSPMNTENGFPKVLTKSERRVPTIVPTNSGIQSQQVFFYSRTETCTLAKVINFCISILRHWSPRAIINPPEPTKSNPRKFLMVIISEFNRQRVKVILLCLDRLQHNTNFSV